MIEPGKEYLIFDGDCGICTWSAGVARRMDSGRRFAVEPYQRFGREELERFGVPVERCAKKLQVIGRGGRIRQGAFAINYFLWSTFPWRLLVILIYAFPVLLLLEIVAYAAVAANRRRLSSLFGLRGCTTPRERP